MRLALTDDTALTQKYYTFQIDPEASFFPELRVVNDSPDSNPFALFFFLDYKQIPVTYEGQDTSVINLQVAPRSEIKFHITIPKLTVGRHDFIALAVRKPQVHLKEPRFIAPEQMFMARRITLIVGSDVSPRKNFTDIKGTNSNWPIDSIVVVTKEHPKNTLENITLIKRDESDKLWVNFLAKRPDQYFAVILLLDNEQVAIQNPFIRSSASGLISLPINPKVPQDNNSHELIAMVIESPFERIEDESGNFLIKSVPWLVRFTNKITIQ